MKFRNKETGVVLEARSELVEKQLSKNDRFEEYTGKDPGGGEKPLTQMNKAELMAKAVELEITVPENAKNAAIVELIKKAVAGQ